MRFFFLIVLVILLVIVLFIFASSEKDSSKEEIFSTEELIFKVEKGQESFRIKPFTKSNAWGLFPNGKANFKKNDYIKCYTLTGIN